MDGLELVEAVAGADDTVMELFIGEEHVDGPTLQAAIRRSVSIRI